MPPGLSSRASLRSAPAENARSPPAKTTHRLCLTSSLSNAARSSRSTPVEIAFSFSSRWNVRTQTAPSLRTSSRPSGKRGHRALAEVRKRDRRVLRVDLARQAVAVEDRVRDELGRDAVADPVDGLDPLGLEPLLVRAQLVVERVV